MALPADSTSAAAHAAALQMLYAVELDHQSPAAVRAWYRTAHAGEDDVLDRAARLVDAAVERDPDISALIARHSHHWRLERIDVVDRCLLKLAVGEMLTQPGAAAASASINAALRLARRFSQPGVVGFLHATLDAIAAEIIDGRS